MIASPAAGSQPRLFPGWQSRIGAPHRALLSYLKVARAMCAEDNCPATRVYAASAV
jgi:hypothetical protein